MTVPIDHSNRRAVVTGAGKGIGRAYAEWFGAHGAKVVVNNRSHPGVPSSARAVADAINAAGGTMNVSVVASRPTSTKFPKTSTTTTRSLLTMVASFSASLFSALTCTR